MMFWYQRWTVLYIMPHDVLISADDAVMWLVGLEPQRLSIHLVYIIAVVSQKWVWEADAHPGAGDPCNNVRSWPSCVVCVSGRDLIVLYLSQKWVWEAYAHPGTGNPRNTVWSWPSCVVCVSGRDLIVLYVSQNCDLAVLYVSQKWFWEADAHSGTGDPCNNVRSWPHWHCQDGKWQDAGVSATNVQTRYGSTSAGRWRWTYWYVVLLLIIFCCWRGIVSDQ